MFKPGVEYRTRNGSTARVYATDGGGARPIHGACTYCDGEFWPMQWTASGRVYTDGPSDGGDLMPPEPERERVRLWSAPSAGMNCWVECTVDPDGTLKLVR